MHFADHCGQANNLTIRMRGFKQAAATNILPRGHACIQNLRNGFSRLTATVPRHLRVMTAWSQLAQAI
jgi:hypothetical protein